jgi:dienelactone hydrolase
MDGCLVYSFSKSARTCSLKRNCPVKPRNEDFITGWVVNPKQQEAARYQVGRGYYELSGYKCGGGNPATVLFYPKGTGPFPVVVYGHGAWGYVDGSDDWLETVSSLGLIVIAPFQGKDPHPCKKAFADDLLNAIQGSKEGGAELHPALSTANWTKTGIFGHSKGAKYATLAASKGKESHGVSAVVCSSDAPSKHYRNTVPTMLTTGTLDKFNDEDQILHYWERSTAEPKVYVNLKDAYHMEVQEGMRLNLLTGQFLSCHVSGNPEDCNVIYGTGDDSICKVNDYADGSCCVQQGSERVNNEFCHSTTTTTTMSTSLPSCSSHWEQCGGRHWNGQTKCCAGLVCQFQNDEYSQCAPTTLEANQTVMV